VYKRQVVTKVSGSIAKKKIETKNNDLTPVLTTPTQHPMEEEVKLKQEDKQFTLFPFNLSLHDRGVYVRKLQMYLNKNGSPLAQSGYGSIGNETDYFGMRTYRALLLFQKNIGLPATGFLGPQTRLYLNKQDY
jgi:peptidoglycan hydrolase-like protein with peptidoglycan-binding domain